MDKIIVLLNHHHVFPVDDSRMYIVLMQAEHDGNVHMAEFEKMEGQEIGQSVGRIDGAIPLGGM